MMVRAWSASSDHSARKQFDHEEGVGVLDRLLYDAGGRRVERRATGVPVKAADGALKVAKACSWSPAW